MLYLIGLGLYDERDISVKGIEAIETCEEVYAEFYTAMLQGTSLSAIEDKLGKKILLLRREDVEEDKLPLQNAAGKDVALLVAGDPLVATTHTDLLIEAHRRGIETRVIHSSSIISAAPGIAGLQAYKFGRVTTIPFTEENYFPTSPYLNIKKNLENRSHTLVLLDIQAHEKRYMTANQAIEYLLRAASKLKDDTITGGTLGVVIARAGSERPLVRAGRIEDLALEDFGEPLHCMIIPSSLHFMEGEYLVEVAGAPRDLVNEMII